MVVVVVVDDEVEELQRLDRARVLVKPPQQPIIKHNVSTWINRVGYTVHMVEETCYNPNRCICRRGSFIRSSEEISSDESHKGTPLLDGDVTPEIVLLSKNNFLIGGEQL